MIISICGDVCSECPRYVATLNNDISKLEEIAELWFRLGFRDKLLSAEDLKCWGCNKKKYCSLNINSCNHLKGINNCGECNLFPCEKIENVFYKSEINNNKCRSKCSGSEYEEMYKAFFRKRKILSDINFKMKNQKNKIPESFEIESCSLNDYNQIINDITDFWGSDRTLHVHNPILIHEFGNTAFVIKHGEKVIAYLFGFFSQTENTAYVHLMAVRDEFQKKGMGEALYNHFIEIARSNNIKKVKAITSPGNAKSINFHKNKIGMTLLGKPNDSGINVIKDYSGIGQDRVVFEKDI